MGRSNSSGFKLPADQSALLANFKTSYGEGIKYHWPKDKNRVAAAIRKFSKDSISPDYLFQQWVSKGIINGFTSDGKCRWNAGIIANYMKVASVTFSKNRIAPPEANSTDRGDVENENGDEFSSVHPKAKDALQYFISYCLQGSSKFSFEHNAPKSKTAIRSRILQYDKNLEPDDIIKSWETLGYLETFDDTRLNWNEDKVEDLQLTRTFFIQEPESLKIWETSLTSMLNQNGGVYYAALHCYSSLDELVLVQVRIDKGCFIFDVGKLGNDAFIQSMSSFLSNKSVVKIAHDLYELASMKLLFHSLKMRGFLDIQIVLEFIVGRASVTFLQAVEYFGKTKMGPEYRINFSEENRPFSNELLYSSTKVVNCLFEMKNDVMKALDKFQLEWLRSASDTRLSKKFHGVGFNVSDSYALMSVELLEQVCPKTMFRPSKMIVHSDINGLLKVLPKDLRDRILALDSSKLSDIVLDKQRPPLCWINGERTYLASNPKCEDEFIMPEDLEYIANDLYFGEDNRASLEKELHRISRICNRSGDTIGLTMRVGRHVYGNADMIRDLLFANREISILFLGEPGCGKTTIIRESARLLAQTDNVFIVDTSNEIAGDGDTPHPCVGNARRMMIPSLNEQADIMVECVQNHTPHTIIIDEIGRPNEVEAARTCKQRGVRIIASAHGDLRKLIKNNKLRGLIGGVESVTLGDAQAMEQARKKGRKEIMKTLTQRAGEPIFDVIIELQRNRHHEWHIVNEVEKAVDDVLDMKEYEVQIRTRNPETGEFRVKVDMK